ncbi:MAG: prepilin-type N-terminal cleavage/methylation domain-containing protein [Proteobacteria bacterium]|nr:prepilin-type N-terminal cleavage/methylation domain-containing protein [Pseudomonadota bacterium]
MSAFPWKKTLSDRRGFTLLELMVVVMILGIISAIAIPQFQEYIRKGWESSAESDLKNGFNAAQAFFTDWPQETATVDLLKEYG